MNSERDSYCETEQLMKSLPDLEPSLGPNEEVDSLKSRAGPEELFDKDLPHETCSSGHQDGSTFVPVRYTLLTFHYPLKCYYNNVPFAVEEEVVRHAAGPGPHPLA